MSIKSYLILFLFLTPVMARAQITINVPQANIINKSDYLVNFNAGSYASLIGLIPTISIRANEGLFSSSTGSTSTIPLNAANIKLVTIGSLSVLGLSSEVPLSTSYGNLYAALLSISSGSVTASLRLVTAGQAWNAGTYRTPIQFRTSFASPNQISPNIQDLNLVIPAFLTVPVTSPPATLVINNFNYFRQAAGITASSHFAIAHSVAFAPSIRTNSPRFSFSTNTSFNTLPTTNVNTVSLALTGISGSVLRLLTTENQALTSSPINVPIGNTQSLTGIFTISADNLKLGFLQAGKYNAELTYTWEKPLSTYPSGALQQVGTGSLEVTVNDMAELIANQSTVSLSVSMPEDFRNGVSINMPAHLRLSKTSPYNLYVRASTSSFSSGSNTIPLDVVQIAPMPGQSGVNTITLSATTQQLINSADPVVDRDLSISYRIPASKTPGLLGKPTGVYSTDIIFSFVAP